MEMDTHTLAKDQQLWFQLFLDGLAEDLVALELELDQEEVQEVVQVEAQEVDQLAHHQKSHQDSLELHLQIHHQHQVPSLLRRLDRHSLHHLQAAMRWQMDSCTGSQSSCQDQLMACIGSQSHCQDQ